MNTLREFHDYAERYAEWRKAKEEQDRRLRLLAVLVGAASAGFMALVAVVVWYVAR